MRRFWLCNQGIVIGVVILALSGCAGSSQYLTSISNKNGGSVRASDIPQPSSVTPKCQNQTWCHNGWCSTHCETITSDN